MSKNFLILIALSLYVGNSNCAAAGTSKEQYENRARMSAFEVTKSPYLVVKILNILLDELRDRRGIEMHHKKSILEEYRKMVLKKAEALDKSKDDSKLKILLMKIYDLFTPDCLNHNMIIIFLGGTSETGWSNDRDLAWQIQINNSIASQKYENRFPKVSHDDLVWKVLTAKQVKDLQ